MEQLGFLQVPLFLGAFNLLFPYLGVLLRNYLTSKAVQKSVPIVDKEHGT